MCITIYSFRSSRDTYLKTAVGYVQISRTGSECIVKAKIVPEHRIANKLYTVTCKIDEQHDTITDSSCDDCAAAEGQLFYSSNIILNNITTYRNL